MASGAGITGFSDMKVLNAYAGIGGNRHLWPDDWQITAVEIDERIALEYARRYPNDRVLVEDAHQFILENATSFDAVWTSPPCPTHSRIMRSKRVKPTPDPRLWEEIGFLRQLEISYVVENVHTYYDPPIAPDVVTPRHYYWVSFAPPLIAGHGIYGLIKTRGSNRPRPDSLAAAYGIPAPAPGAVSDRLATMRNAVVPSEGLQIALAAFAPKLHNSQEADRG